MENEELFEPISVLKHETQDGKIYSVTFSNGEVGEFSDEEFFEFGLYDTQDALPYTYDDLMYRVCIKRAYFKACSFLRGSLKPERFVFDKLRYEDFGDEVIDSVIKRLREEGSVNDYKYCLKHSQKRLAAGNVSRKYIVCELREKGIDDSLTERCLDELGADDREIACRIAKKRLKSGDKKEKIKRFLSGKGFSAGTIIFAVDTCDTSDLSESELVFDSDFDM